MSRQTLNEYLSFATHLLQLRAFSHIPFSIKSIIYEVIDLRISSSALSLNIVCISPILGSL